MKRDERLASVYIALAIIGVCLIIGGALLTCFINQNYAWMILGGVIVASMAVDSFFNILVKAMNDQIKKEITPPKIIIDGKERW